MEFLEFPKLPRLTRDCVITEKIDGTNAQILIVDLDEPGYEPDGMFLAQVGNLAIRPGSRNRYITPEDDNYGFAGWVLRNAEELAQLGPGRHFGEWWGQGIQRKYGLKEKRFSLFNTGRWVPRDPGEKQAVPPACCHIVPVLYRGIFCDGAIQMTLHALNEAGSVASPGYMDPEGIVIFHEASGVSFKKTIRNDESPKSKVNPSK